MKRPSAWVLGAGLFIAVAGVGLTWLSTAKAERRAYEELPDFSMEGVRARDRGTVSKASLAGRVWVAGFVFVHCSGPCPLVTRSMARLQDRLPRETVLVTFTVDPDRDTPEILEHYARSWEADPERWWFVRGEKAALLKLMYEGFKLPMLEDRDAPSGFRVTHSTRLVVVDSRGRPQGYFPSDDEESLKALEKEVLRLTGRTPAS